MRALLAPGVDPSEARKEERAEQQQRQELAALAAAGKLLLAIQAQPVEAFPKLPAAVALDHAIERVDHLGILLLRQRRRPVVRRPRQACGPAGSRDRQAMLGPAASRTASEFFASTILDRRVLQRQVGVHALEPGVLRFQLAHARQVRDRRTRSTALPRVVR